MLEFLQTKTGPGQSKSNPQIRKLRIGRKRLDYVLILEVPVGPTVQSRSRVRKITLSLREL